MTTSELQAINTAAVRMPTLITDSRKTEDHGSLVVVDSARDAWDESDQQAIRDLRDTFGDDLVNTHETALRHAGHWLIETHLRTEWRARGYFVAFNDTDGDSSIYATPSDEVCHQVWQAAADAITDCDLVLEAGLGHVFQMTTELEMHRAVLHHRLNAIAATFDDDTCEKAWQQLDGQRAAVDNAKTRPQLIELGTQIPA